MVSKLFSFSSNLTVFDQSETQFEHLLGRLVRYDNELLAIGGISENPTVEAFKQTGKRAWEVNPMSPVVNVNMLADFNALTL